MTAKGKMTAAAGREDGKEQYKDPPGNATKGSTADVANHGMNRKPEAERLKPLRNEPLVRIAPLQFAKR